MQSMGGVGQEGQGGQSSSQSSGQQGMHYAQQFVSQPGQQQLQYVQPGGQQQFVLANPQGGVQGGQGQQYVVMMPSGGQDQQGGSQGALAQAFGGLGVQPDQQKRVQRGIVKRWDLEKGYGFIQPVEGGDDVFVHHSVIHAQGFKSLMEGSEVEYESLQIAPGRIRAQRVTGPGGSYAKGAPRPPNPPMIRTAGGSGSGMQVVQLVQLPHGQTAQVPAGQPGPQFIYTTQGGEMQGQSGRQNDAFVQQGIQGQGQLGQQFAFAGQQGQGGSGNQQGSQGPSPSAPSGQSLGAIGGDSSRGADIWGSGMPPSDSHGQD